MKKTIISLVVGGGLILGASQAFADTAVMRLEQGVALMSDETKLKEALREFQGVLLAEGKSEKLAAEARYHMAECYLKLGEKDLADAQLKKLRENYPAKNKWVLRAKKLNPPSTPFDEKIPWRDGEFFVYDIVTKDGKTAGGMMYLTISASEHEGQPTWTTSASRTGASLMQSRLEFYADGFRPIKGRGYAEPFGELLTSYSDDGSWSMSSLPSGEIVSEGQAMDGGWSASPFFENDQTIQLLRLLPTEVGTDLSLTLNASLQGGAIFPFELKVTAHEDVETPAGKFACAKYESNIGQTFWVNREEPRELVRIGFGLANIDLVSTHKVRSLETPVEIKMKGLKGSIELPTGSVFIPGTDNKKIFRAQLLDPEFRFLEGMVEVQPTKNYLENLHDSERNLLNFLIGQLEEAHDEMEVDENSWKEFAAGNHQGASVTCRIKNGEIEQELSLAAMHGTKLTTVIRLKHQTGKGHEVEALLAAAMTSVTE